MSIRKLFVLCAAVVLGIASPTHAQFSAFTYQGELLDQTNPANGLYDLQFSLFDVETGGSPVAATQCANDVTVSRGRFTVELDFGGLDLQSLFIEIAVRRDTGLDCANTSGFTLLSTRQKVGITPFSATASFSLNTQLLGGRVPSFYNQASNLTGLIPSASLSGIYTQPLTLNNSLNLYAGNGSGLTALNASNLSQGTLADSRLSSNVALLNRSQTFTGANNFSGATTFGSTTAFNGLATFNAGIAIPATPRVLSIPAHGFKPSSTTMDVTVDSLAIRALTAGQSVSVDAPVHLPDGAVITEFSMFATDNDTFTGFTFVLVRVGLASGSANNIASLSTSAAGASASVQTLTTTTITGAVVDNSQFAYYVRASWGSPNPGNLSVRGVRIRYTMTSLVP